MAVEEEVVAVEEEVVAEEEVAAEEEVVAVEEEAAVVGVAEAAREAPSGGGCARRNRSCTGRNPTTRSFLGDRFDLVMSLRNHASPSGARSSSRRFLRADCSVPPTTR